MILPKEHLLKSDFISDFLSEKQFQPAGVDLTLKKVFAFKGMGRIDFDNSERKISKAKELQFDGKGWVKLGQGAYKVSFNEYIKIPQDMMALVFPRSSLLRCGAALHTAVWDPGYEGRGEMLLVVHNKNGMMLKRNAKVGQMVFVKLAEETKHAYEGMYKGEHRH
ncbi:MAG: deoxyuridine 5'-triphosphate nucleotidohydrolase [Candidatus Anstonellales archaeon]